ncbi:hypothetical protein [Staphylococcus simulans]|uniref:hypothetical protein n=1 Tax=Staphylococcus simulans TaxID=1286 RepID=UPI000AADA862|nr:hypothetical protein [Staphylococcus simulans]MDQ7111801.1 hypothetical protein [Staphylococcus simulans]MDQ7118961.1 hypothetical protein [Staphylococcus simulans]UXR35562.1 hypothetical protein MUA31_01120 [Staphylococcus simulans]UXR47793.1 hypothetical protein MUA57_01085 [Staphylococcus simulans]UXR52744.1 hypothetical protein MUA82_01050 [Staphylococcus simulans]
MTTINNELSKRLQQLEEGHVNLLKNLLNDLVNANTILEQEKAKDRFKNEVSKFVREKE